MKVARLQSILGGDKVMIARQTLLFLQGLETLADLISAAEHPEKTDKVRLAVKKIRTNLAIYEMHELIESTDEFCTQPNDDATAAFLRDKGQDLISLIEKGKTQLVDFTNTLR